MQSTPLHVVYIATTLHVSFIFLYIHMSIYVVMSAGGQDKRLYMVRERVALVKSSEQIEMEKVCLIHACMEM